MPSDLYIGSLLKTLVASKPGGRFLELGTGISLSLSWMLEGMNNTGYCVSIDNNEELIDIAKSFYGDHPQLELICGDGGEWIQSYSGEGFDLIFADAWPGKYELLDETLAMLKPGGFYVIDDMIQQANWPEGHDLKAADLIKQMEERKDIQLTKMNWSTGVIIAAKLPYLL